MSIDLIIRPNSTDIAQAETVQSWQWLRLDRKGQHAAQSDIGLRPPASAAALLLIPANWLHIQRLELPAMRRAQLQQAIPFALEEYVAGDVERLHVVHERAQADATVTAVAIEPTLLRGLLQQLDALQITCVQAIPDACWQTPSDAAELSVLALQDDYLVSSATDQLLLNATELNFLLAQQSSTSRVQWYGPTQPALDWSGQLQLNRHADPFKLLAAKTVSTNLNLLQGDFAVSVAAGEVRAWRLAVGLAAALTVLSFGYMASDWWLLKREVDRYQTEVQSVFRETFPNITNVVNPRVQAERELARMNPAQADALLSLMALSAPVLSAQAEIELESINYDRTGLRFEVSADSVAELDELTAALQQQGIGAQLDGAVRSADSVRGQIVVAGSNG